MEEGMNIDNLVTENERLARLVLDAASQAEALQFELMKHVVYKDDAAFLMALRLKQALRDGAKCPGRMQVEHALYIRKIRKAKNEK